MVPVHGIGVLVALKAEGGPLKFQLCMGVELLTSPVPSRSLLVSLGVQGSPVCKFTIPLSDQPWSI